MREGGLIIMSTKELQKSEIIRQVIDHKIKQNEAAYRLELSSRQIRRLVSKYRSYGPPGLIHASRGKSSHKTKQAHLKRKTLHLWHTKYHDFGPTFFAEKLKEKHQISLSRETLRNWYPKETSKPPWQRKRRIRRHYRDRKHHFGEMIQTDGSQHAWFEDRAPKCNLQAMIDDATGIVFARFYEYEGTLPAMDLMKKYTRIYGIPYSIYFDMHSTYKSSKRLTKEQRISGEEALSQFGRALDEISVRRIYAQSPQAKGRVERLFGTLQDRLVKELRLHNISTIKNANIFLDSYLIDHNKRFSKTAAASSNWHQHHLTPKQITRSLCIKRTRVIQKDSTISYFKQRFLILNPISKITITIEEYPDGSMLLRAPTNKELKYKRIPLELYERNKDTKNKTHLKTDKKPQSKAHKPKPNHPWIKEFSHYANLHKQQQK